MRPLLLAAVLLIGCGPVVAADPCVEVEWELVLHGLVSPRDVVVREDGIVGVLASDAIHEFDERGRAVAVHRLVVGDERLQGRGLFADAMDRWWVTAYATSSDEPGRIRDWLVRIDPDGISSATQSGPMGKVALAPIVELDQRILAAGGDHREELQPDLDPEPGRTGYPLATVVSLGEELSVTDAWTSTPDLASVSSLLPVDGKLLVLANPPSIDWAPGELLRLDAFDQGPAWTRTVGLLGAGSTGVQDSASGGRHALLLSGAFELANPDEELEPGVIPDTQFRTWVDAWTIDGELAWSHDLTVGSSWYGRLASSGAVILSRLVRENALGQPEASFFVVDDGGVRLCEQPTKPGAGLSMAAAPAWGPDAFVSLEQRVLDEPQASYRLVRLRVPG